MSFCDATRVTQGKVAGTFHAVVPDGWQQGAGAFGGFVLAVMIRAIETMAPDRALRSLTAEIPAPVRVGPITLAVDVLREGKSVTVVAARLSQDSELRAHAVAVLGTARPVARSLDHTELAPPVVRSWRDTPALPVDLEFLPAFAQHFEFRPADGAPFRSAAASPRVPGDTPTQTTGWIRARDPGPAHDAALVVGHVDAWYPAEFARLRGPRPMVTAAFTMQVIHGAAAFSDDAPLLHTSRTLVAYEGYVIEARELWTGDGRLVATNQQTFVMVK